MPRHQPAPTRLLPEKPSLAQLRKQAKDLLRSYQAREPSAVDEVERFEREPNPADFALADAQRILARAYGFPRWTKLKQHVDGINAEAFLAAADAGDVATVRKLANARPELVNPQTVEFLGSALHRAVLNRNAEMTRVLMELGSDAHKGIWPHRAATSAYAIAKDRQYHEIVAVIEHEEMLRRRRLSSPGAAIDSRLGDVLCAIGEGRSDEAIAVLAGEQPLIGSCNVQGVSPLHAAARAHDPSLVGWLVEQGAGIEAQDALGRTPLDHAAVVAGWSANDRFFPFLENARVEPARFEETVQRLRSSGAELTPRAAVAIGDGRAVSHMHRRERLKNEVDFYRGGLLAIAVRVNRIDMVSLLLDLGLDPDEPAATSDDGGESWGFPLWFAALCGRHDIAQLLLARGADVNAIVYACGDPLCNALQTADAAMKSLLLKHTARITVEHVAQSGDRETARAMLDGRIPAHSLNVDEPSPAKVAAQLLHSGVRNADPEIVRMCLEHIPWNSGDPSWHYALVQCTSPDCLEVILAHGVDPDAAAEGEPTALHHVATFDVAPQERVALATRLLEAGASFGRRDALLLSTPLGWACRWGRNELVTLYLERGADAIEPDAQAWAAPLVWAVKGGHDAIVRLLEPFAAE